MVRRKRTPRPEKPQSSTFYDNSGRAWHVSAQYQPSGDVYLYVPRDRRYWLWHKSYWHGVPEWARDKDYSTGLHWVAQPYAASAVSVLLAFYPEAEILKP